MNKNKSLICFRTEYADGGLGAAWSHKIAASSQSLHGERRAKGIEITDEVPRHISPLGSRHLIFNGDYLLGTTWRKVVTSREKSTPKMKS